MDEIVKPYSVCPACGVGRLSPEPQHRPKDAHLTFPGKAMLHCYNFALHAIGCGNAVPAPTPAQVVAANLAETHEKLAAEADAKAKTLEGQAVIAKNEAERLRTHRVGSYPLLSDAEVASMTPEAAAKLQADRAAYDAAHLQGPKSTDLLSADEIARLSPAEQRDLIQKRREWDAEHAHEA